MRPFLLIQSRPEPAAADDEARAFARFGGLGEGELVRLAIDRGEMPEIDLADWSGVIVGGGPANFSAAPHAKPEAQQRFEPWLFDVVRRCVDEDFPYLGACLGLGALVHAVGSRMEWGVSEPVAPVTVRVVGDDPLLDGFPTEFAALGGHKEGLADAPDGLEVVAVSDRAIHMVRAGDNVWATQFHPELDGDGLELRIRIYQDYGYFRPEDAEGLIAAGHAVDVPWPGELLRRFVAHARR